MAKRKLSIEKLREYGAEIKEFGKELREYGKEIEASVPKAYRHEVYRKGIHLSSLWIPALIYFTTTETAIGIFLAILVGDLILEYGNYKRWKWARIAFTILFSRTLRNNERAKSHFTASGGAYVLASALICTLLFSNIVAAIALTVMLISDTLAALVGKALGQRKIYKDKSLEGTVAFFVSALIIMMLFNPVFQFTYISALACFAATFVELFEDRLEMDDNFSIPLSVGAILTLMV